MLVFGGYGGLCMSDFRQFAAGSTWSMQKTESGPPPRSHHAVAFDDVTESLLLGLDSELTGLWVWGVPWGEV